MAEVGAIYKAYRELIAAEQDENRHVGEAFDEILRAASGGKQGRRLAARLLPRFGAEMDPDRGRIASGMLVKLGGEGSQGEPGTNTLAAQTAAEARRGLGKLAQEVGEEGVEAMGSHLLRHGELQKLEEICNARPRGILRACMKQLCEQGPQENSAKKNAKDFLARGGCVMAEFEAGEEPEEGERAPGLPIGEEDEQWLANEIAELARTHGHRIDEESRRAVEAVYANMAGSERASLEWSEGPGEDYPGEEGALKAREVQLVSKEVEVDHEGGVEEDVYALEPSRIREGKRNNGRRSLIASFECEREAVGAFESLRGSGWRVRFRQPQQDMGLVWVERADRDEGKGEVIAALARDGVPAPRGVKIRVHGRAALLEYAEVPRELDEVVQSWRESQLEGASLWVGRVSRDCTEKELAELFGEHGPVVGCRVLRQSRCAFVNFRSKLDATRALRDLHGFSFRGSQLNVQFKNQHRS